MKLYGYFISGFLILLADAFHTISDIASIALLMYSGYLSRKPADISHPFGHEMVKNIASLIAAVVFITIMSFELLKEGINKLFHPSATYSNTSFALIIEIAVLSLLILSAF